MDAADFVTADMQRAEQRFEMQRKAQAVTMIRQSTAHCKECDDEIPEQRQKLITGVRLCAPCQTQAERKRW